MAVNCSSTAGVGGPSFAFSGTASGTPNLRSGTYTLAGRVRWSLTSSPNDFDHFAVGLAVSTSDGSGAYIERVAGDASTTLEFYRTNTAGTTIDAATMTGGFGSTTAWVHVAMTYDGTNITPYINGVAGTPVASATGTCTNAVAGYIQLCGPASGDFVDAVFFSRALTAAEISRLASERQSPLGHGDCFGWYPMFSSGTLSDCGKDYSGKANHAAIVNSGTGNPVSSNVTPPTTWGGSHVLTFDNIVRAVAAIGSTQTTGTAAVSAQLLAIGTTNTTGAAAVSAQVTAVGTTNATGSAAVAAQLSVVGTTNTSGAASVSSSGTPIVPVGTTNTTGTVAVSAQAPGAGTTQTTGAAAVVPQLLVVGSTQTTGAVTGSPQAPAAGSTQTTGSVALAAVVTATGSTQSSGAAALSAQFAATGTTTTSGASTMSSNGLTIITASGSTQTNGLSSISVAYALVAAGNTQTTGVATFQGTAPSSGGDGAQTGSERRWSPSGSPRRRVRR